MLILIVCLLLIYVGLDLPSFDILCLKVVIKVAVDPQGPTLNLLYSSVMDGDMSETSLLVPVFFSRVLSEYSIVNLT